MTFVPWEQTRDYIDEKIGLTDEETRQGERELEAYITGYHLGELRKQAGLTQVELAKRLGVGQPRVSAMERGDLDTLTLGSIRAYVEALGGTISVVAHVDDADITLEMPAEAA